MRSVRTWVVLGLAGWLGLAGCAEQVPDGPPSPSPPGPATPSAPVDPISRAEQSLVLVNAGNSASVGVVIAPEGHVLAFFPQLAEDPDRPVAVTLVKAGQLDAVTQGHDPRTDLVVVTVEPPEGLVPAVLGDSDAVAVGDEVTLLNWGPDGEPRAVPGEITTTGEVLPGFGTVMIGFSVEGERPGGGPVVNGAGEVIGIYSASSSGAGSEAEAHFAIPSSAMASIADQLVETGEVVYPYLGVTVDDAPGGGAVIEQVAPGGPADTAGLRTGDVIVQVGDRPVEVAADVVVAVQAQAVGDEVAVTYLRDGAEAEATATLVPAPAG